MSKTSCYGPGMILREHNFIRLLNASSDKHPHSMYVSYFLIWVDIDSIKI